MNKLQFLLLVLATGFVTFFANAQNNTSTKQYVLNNTQNITVAFEPSQVVYNKVETPNGSAFTLSLDKGSPLLEKGAPHLSKLTASVLVSATAMYKPVVVESAFTDYQNVTIAPDKGNLYRNQDPNQIPYSYGPQYTTNAFYPANLAELRDPYVLRDARGVTVVAYPMQYNPVTKVLRVYSKLVIELVETAETLINPLQKSNSSALYQEFSQVYSRHFLNYASAKYTPVTESGKLLIICHPEYVDAIAPLVEWKNERGLQTELVTYSSATTGTTANSLKTYVANYYNTNHHSFLLLVGDAEQIPSLNQSGDSDVAYSYVAGNDSYPEFFVGRFSAQSVADVQTQVARTIYYEKEMGTEATWLATATGIASAEGGKGSGDDGESDIQHMNNIRTDLVNYGYTTVDQVYDPGASATTVANAVNNGRGVMNYVGHGADTYWVTTNFGNSNVNQLTNENKLPFIFDVACVNGNFHGQTCFAESWLRAQKNGNPTGAVAIIASTINQSWSPPMDGQDEMNDILVESYQNNIKRSFGGIVYNGCLHMNDAYGSGGDEMTNTWTTFGDPSLLVRTKAPQTMAISHDSEILIGTSSFTVNCDAVNALACLSKDGVIVATGTVTDGSVALSFDAFSDVGTCKLVITGYNKKTYIATVSIIPASGPFLSVQAFIIDDAQNQQVENGESFKINIALKNVGIEIANNTTARLTSNDTNLTIANTIYQFGSIGIGNSATGGQFVASAKYHLSDQYLAKFTINVTSGQYNWQKQASLKVNAPDILLSGATIIEDGAFGDGNGRIDPGETGFVSIQVANNGHADADSVTVMLNTLNVYLTQIGVVRVKHNLVVGASDTVLFKVSAHEATPQGSEINCTANAFCNNTVNLNYTLTIGQKPEITLGTSTTQVENYPFNNYYENNKTQLLYLKNEVGVAAITLSAIEFDFKAVTVAADKRDLKDFTIKLGYSNLNQLTGSYTTISNPVQVFFESTFLIPTSTGWHTFDIADFAYDPALGNLVVEILWGDNGEYCASTDRTYLNGTSTAFSSVVYGINDSQTPPNYSGASNLRPNTRFKTVSEVSALQNVAILVKSSNSGLPLEGALVTIGSLVQTASAQGTVNATLANGTYTVQASSELYFNYTGTITVDESNTQFELLMTTLGPTHDVEFSITDETLAVQNAKVVFYGKTLYTNATGNVRYTFVPEGERAIAVSKAGYYNSQATFNIVSDTNIAIQLDKIPVYDVEFNITEKGTPLNGVSIKLNNITNETNQNGTVLFEEVQIAENLVYVVSKQGYYPVTDTFDLVNSSLTFNIELVQVPDVKVQVNQKGGRLKGATVKFQGLNLVTPDSGLVSFVDVNELNDQVLKVSKTGYYTHFDTLNVPATDTSIDVYLRKITDLYITIFDNNNAVQGASVTVNNLTRVTDNEGKVKFIGLQAVENMVCSVQLEGYLTLTETFDITFDDVYKQLTIVPIPDVKFTVTDGSLPIKNAKITLNGTVINSSTDGLAVFENLQNGNYPYTIEKIGFYTLQDTLLIDNIDVDKLVLLKPIPDVKFVVQSNGVPVPGAQVIVNDVTKTVNTNGECTFVDVPSGTVSYTVKKDKYQDYVSRVDIADTNTTVYVELNLVTFNVLFNVTSRASNIEGATVTINNRNYETNELGQVEIRLPIGNDYSYTILKEGYYSAQGTLSVIDADVTREINLELITYSVRFNVIYNQLPLALAEIHFNNETKATNNEGFVEFFGIIPHSKLALEVVNDGFERYQTEITITSDSIIEITLVKTDVPEIGNASIVIYPNPANDFIFVKANSTILKIEMFDLSGRIIQVTNPDGNQSVIKLELPQNAPAVLIKVHTTSGVMVTQIMMNN